MVTKDGQPYHGTKSDLLQIISPKEVHNKLQSPKAFYGMTVDLSAIIQVQATVIDASQFTYSQFADHILYHIESLASKANVKRLDIVADTYQS